MDNILLASLFLPLKKEIAFPFLASPSQFFLHNLLQNKRQTI